MHLIDQAPVSILFDGGPHRQINQMDSIFVKANHARHRADEVSGRKRTPMEVTRGGSFCSHKLSYPSFCSCLIEAGDNRKAGIDTIAFDCDNCNLSLDV